MAEDLDVFVEPIFLAPPAFAQASATVASVPAAAEEASAEGTETGGGSGCGATKLFKKARVQVGAKPLVLRSGPDTDSELIGKLRPGQLLTVLDERRTDDGDGKLHDVHKVTYSVGRAGRYLLHVRLRNQVLPLKGSPFALEVKPGAAHAQSTELPVCALPLRGIVGLGESFGCRFSMKTADKCANLCDRGGGKVECKCLDKNVTTSVVDNNDGTYTLSLRSKYSGTSEVHVTIDGMHVRGSPASMKLTSTQPDLERTVCLGEGLQHASAGKPTTFRVRFVDEHGNTATPGSGLKMGLALVPEAAPRSELVSKKGNSTHVAKKAAITAAELQTLTEHAFESKWVAEGELEIEFVGTTAGFNDLYVWAVDTPKPIKLAKANGGDKGATTKRQASSGAAEKRSQSTLIGGSSSSDIASAAVPLDPRMRMRILLPGAPFSLAISSGKGNIA
ncbi:actin binding protein [Chrysochromulina tobinii]|uniref:Actin binding protein n=1 Tax=Chrysochromulina tobinii TaxID=1460289 RepID=A0A0M0JSP5_9EUKA|nr:actin binding protein [Chrysochromulina tobinii]|eukprot:KOO29609.1 actin binding protein [Chrysochromulina sp. CCMP291]